MHPIRNWLSRHQDPTSFWLHMLGIPATVAAIPLLVLRHHALAAALFAAGYALQFLGHALDGSVSGEEMLVRRLLRRPSRTPRPRPPRPAARSARTRRRG